MKAYRVHGTTNDVTTCELCGKVELKGTVMLVPLDADGNPDGDVSYFGTSCAAKAAGWTVQEVRAGIATVKRAERAAKKAAEKEEIARIKREAWARRDAETKAYNAWIKESGYTSDELKRIGVAALWEAFRAQA